MPQGYGYQGRSGGRRYQSGYQYQQPATAQYESFFNPIPIEFLQQNLQQHQGQFDQAFAGALAAKEAAQQQEIALGDQLYRNQLIDSSMKEMDELANQYGGDYGRASKEIARSVTELRGNEFWASSKHLKEQQALQQKFMLENPDAHLYQDVRNIGAYDPETGGIRGQQQLTFEAGKRGDWQGSVEKQFADIQGKQLFNALQDARIPGYFENVTIAQLKPEDLRKLLDDNPQMVEAFITNNPDFERSGLEIRGQDTEGVREEAKDFILGNILDKPFYKEQGSVTADKEYWLRRTAQIDNQTQSPWGDQAASEDFYTAYNADPSQRGERITYGFFGEDGNIMDEDAYKESITGYIPGQAGRTQGLASAIVGSTRKKIAERKTERRKEDREATKTLVDDLRRNHPNDFDGMSDFDIYNEFLENSSAYEYSVNYSKPLFNEDYSRNIGKATNENIGGIDFYMKGDDRLGATKYTGRGGIEDRTNIPLSVFQEMMVNDDYGKSYDMTDGSYFIEAPIVKGNKGPTISSDGSIDWSKSNTTGDTQRIYFQPDQYTVKTNQVITGLDKGIKTNDVALIQATLANFDPTGIASLDQDALAKAQGNKDVDINEVEMIILPTTDENGRPTGETDLYSINEMRRTYFESQTQRLGQYYFKRD